MEIIIREPKLTPEIDGIPKDFADTRDYFNHSLKDKSLSWIPRKNPITDDEIKKLWIPSLEKNITLVAELNGKVVGQVTVFYDTKSTGYEHAKQRSPGNVGFTAEPSLYSELAEKLAVELIKELKKQNKKAIWTTAYESPGNKILQKLGYKPKRINNQERYKQSGLSGEVNQYELP